MTQESQLIRKLSLLIGHGLAPTDHFERLARLAVSATHEELAQAEEMLCDLRDKMTVSQEEGTLQDFCRGEVYQLYATVKALHEREQQTTEIKPGSMEHVLLQGLSNMVLPTMSRLREWMERQTGIRNPDTTLTAYISLAVKGYAQQVFPANSTELHFKLTQLGEQKVQELKCQSPVRT